MTIGRTDFAFWSRAVLSVLWCEGHGLTVDELAKDLDVPVETMLSVIEVLVARRVLTLDAVAGAVRDALDVAPQSLGLASRVRLASAA